MADHEGCLHTLVRSSSPSQAVPIALRRFQQGSVDALKLSGLEGERGGELSKADAKAELEAARSHQKETESSQLILRFQDQQSLLDSLSREHLKELTRFQEEFREESEMIRSLQLELGNVKSQKRVLADELVGCLCCLPAHRDLISCHAVDHE
eukprot:186960-Hanusia_phi.AAC.2